MGNPVSPGLTIDQLQRFVKRLKEIKPNDKNQYLYSGKTYTKAAWNNFVGGFESRLKEMKETPRPGGGSQVFSPAGQAQLEKDAEIIRIDKLGQSVWRFVQSLKRESDKSLSVPEQNNLRQWIGFYEREMDRLETYANSLAAGGQIRNISGVKLVSLADAKKPFSAPSATPSASMNQPSAPATPPPADVTADISNITSKDQARQEITRLRERSNNLKGLIGERSGGTVLYYEAPGMVGMSKGQRDAIINNIEARITALNFKFFADTPAAAAEPTTPLVTTEPTIPSEPVAAVGGGRGEAVNIIGQPGGERPGVVVTPSPEVTPEVPVDETPDTTPPSDTATTPDATTRPVTPSPVTPSPSYTDPGTGVTYQPGEQVGGEDRTLPNGGAVVDGVYIPPGIDYTWLANQIPDDWKKAAQELYGAYYDMIKNDPQISNLLERAIKESWSDDKFQAELEKTNWWKTTTDNAKAFQILETTRPAEARARLDGSIATVREYAQNMGITLSAESLESLARTSIILDFNLAAQYQDAIGSEAIKSAGGMSQLRYGFVGNSIRESARKYGVALSDVTFNEWVNKIAVGAESTETFESYANQIARNLYPSLNNGFDRGLSFAQMTDPYAQVASRILEIPSSQVDFTDPKWAQAFTMRDEKGQPSQMSFGEWADYLRTTPSFGYEYTDQAVSKAYNVVSDLARAFGAG